MTKINTTALALCIVFPILSISAVIARFCARHVTNQKIGADDWLILPALTFAVGNAATVMVGAITANLGQHAPLDPAGYAKLGPKLTILSKVAYASELFNPAGMCLARFSILLFYTRIFTKSSRYFRYAVYIMYATNLAWGIGFIFAYAFQCVPISHLWSQANGARTGCVRPTINLAYAISTAIIDGLVLIIPWRIVWKLQMPVKQKIAVTGIFMLGAVVTAVSIGKCYTFFNITNVLKKNHDITYDEGPVFYWTVPELCLSVVGACLPTLRPLFHGMSPESIIGSIRSVLSLPSLRSQRGGSGNASQGYASHDWEDDQTRNSTVVPRKTSTERQSEGSNAADVEMNHLDTRSKIKVTKQFDVERA